jgi:uncharacterized protein
MNSCGFDLAGERLGMLPSGAVWWPAQATLVVSDLHLGKAERIARRSGQMLPPYETCDTLDRLEADCAALAPGRVICLGDSFDDGEARDAFAAREAGRIGRLQEIRDWIWITGNHDPGSGDLAGRWVESFRAGPLTFRHIATPGGQAELSGHYHPKARLALGGRRLARRCLLHDRARAILPAYGTYTGGLDWTAPILATLMGPGARAILTGPNPCAVPVPQRARA